jgi:hypothetical protein
MQKGSESRKLRDTTAKIFSGSNDLIGGLNVFNDPVYVLLF